ncbi:MAG: hypothetical protein C4555_06675 [Dehalococcoidia bacterium]|nr:MAG: hypothetical protein C4555_06675 [Dehalococcoidia bacterium]
MIPSPSIPANTLSARIGKAFFIKTHLGQDTAVPFAFIIAFLWLRGKSAALTNPGKLPRILKSGDGEDLLSTEQETLLAALKYAEQMEIDGKAFYLKMSQASINRRGRELFKMLADEEDVHREDFRKIYHSVSNGQDIPKHDFDPEDEHKMRTLFSQAIEELEQDIKAPAGEVEAIDTAIQMEQGGIDFYREQAARAKFTNVRRFYSDLAHEEDRHKATLEDYRRYVVDPEGWLVNKTRPSLGACLLPHAEGSVSELEW